MNQLTVKAVAHADVTGKILYYLKITNGASTTVVNVGKTTYDKVNELETPEKDENQQELPLGSGLEEQGTEQQQQEKEGGTIKQANTKRVGK